MRSATRKSGPNVTTKRTALAIAVAAFGVAALAGCTSGTSKPEPATLTTKEAGAYYLATTCKVDAAADLISAAINIAEQSTESSGPDLDNLKVAALGYEKATRVAASDLDKPKAAWPASVRSAVVVLRNQYVDQLSPLTAMANADQMSDAAAALSDLPDSTKASAAAKTIRSKLGLPLSTASNSCPPPPTLSVAPATGVLITGTGYTFHAPSGWTLPTSSVQADSYAISATPNMGGLYDTINVLIQPTNHDSFNAEEQHGVEYLQQVVGATAIQVRPRVEIAGAEAVHISSLQTQRGIVRRDEQYLVTHDGTDLTITFNFDEAEPQPDRETLAEAVLASWTWT